MTTNKYAQCRFIGYAIPTGPSQDKLILSKYLVGNYLGATDIVQDLSARIAILKNAVDTAKQALPAGEDTQLVNNIFMAPEFYFHGPLGPYVYRHTDEDPAELALKMLAKTFNPQEYPNWTFVFGTMISAKVANIDAVFQSPAVKMRKRLVESLALNAEAEFGNARSVTEQILSDTIIDLRANPAVQVRDRALVFSNLGLQLSGQSQTHQSLTTEKYFLSPIDFVLFETNNQDVITEEMVAYPHIDLSDGDVKKHVYDSYAIFNQNFGQNNVLSSINYGIEICLDHDDARLRKNMNRENLPANNTELQIQLVPSSGSVIMQQCVVVGKNGFVFNVDGWCALDNSVTPQADNVAGVQSVYTNYTLTQNGTQYSAHTQLAQVKNPAQGCDPNKYPADFQFLSAENVISLNVPEPILDVGSFSEYFAGGYGSIQIYGGNTPYDLFSEEIDNSVK
ncbi:hypothetical protein [Undibacterium baiyunense]|uniref:Uncharacterized protein n=1 Tax=Undibacterium baiyunense TaxID=2828731 RepID=A0A941I3W7_9BURK|nr:hypothetical protein [Undibacterium baiyunense]MBR7746404.1 hypothetical protein [Undibacterium baiyunense]